MSAGFGFSAGDIVAGLKLIKQSIDALQDSKGSSSEFERLVREINSLEVSLDCVQDLNLDATGGARSKQRLALQEAIENCQRCIDHFLSLISKYQPWLRAKVASRHAWKGNLMKIQWALCRKEDIKGFRAQLERHCSSINMLLIALQV